MQFSAGSNPSGRLLAVRIPSQVVVNDDDGAVGIEAEPNPCIHYRTTSFEKRCPLLPELAAVRRAEAKQEFGLECAEAANSLHPFDLGVTENHCVLNAMPRGIIRLSKGIEHQIGRVVSNRMDGDLLTVLMGSSHHSIQFLSAIDELSIGFGAF